MQTVSQAETLQAMDDAIHASILAAGLAFVGSYTPPASAPGETITNVRGYYDEAVASVGEFAQGAGFASEITLLRSSIPRPAQHGVVEFDGRQVKLDVMITRDQSSTRWAVSNV